MTFRIRLYLSIIFFTLFSFGIHAQSDSFRIEDYQEFISAHQNMSPEDLLNLYPAGEFRDNVHQSVEWAIYFDSVATKYNLTEYEKSLITQNGFMVSERVSANSFGHQFLNIYHKDLPVFISADAILHAFHISYDYILQKIEVDLLYSKVGELLENLHSQISGLNGLYGGNPQMLQCLKDVDVYLTVPRKLLTSTSQPFYADNNNKINEILALIEGQGMSNYNLFGDFRGIDFSQFKPRGHYEDERYPQLRKYFKAMMWLGRIEIYLIAPRSILDIDDAIIQRQVTDASLIMELLELASAENLYNEIENIIAFFVGEQDNVTIPNFKSLLTELNITNANQLLDETLYNSLKNSLKSKSYAFQRILSQVLFSNPFSPDSIIPASAFMLFGQRFIMDSYVTGNVVYDRIAAKRMLPSTLDILFALGNDAAAQLLQDEMNRYEYASQLTWLRYLVDNYDNEFWNSSIYNMWLNSIRSLNPPENKNELPMFMKSGAWWQHKMNGQLASWTELRHDNLLYAKQSYTGGVVCSYPYSYVEPVPEFFAAMKTMTDNMAERFQTGILSGYTSLQSIIDYLNNFSSIAATLEVIASKELAREDLIETEIDFLKSMLSEEPGCVPVYSGWYVQLFWGTGDNYNGLLKSDFLVADYHTSPTDENGFYSGWVAHAGTGQVNLAVVVTELPNGQTCAFAGPVSSYYEYTSTNFLRLNDDEWKNTYMFDAARPDWVNIYLANSEGELRGPGLSLITGIDNYGLSNDEISTSSIIAQNYPNPFNAATLINFTIPRGDNSYITEIIIYDIQGRQIKALLHEELPPGNYVTRWDGKNHSGEDVSSGIYFFRIISGKNQAVGKMNLLK